MIGHYDYRLVILAFVVGMITSLATLILATKIHRSTTAAANYWLAAGAVTVGSGIWATHFIGMLAYKLSMTLAFSTPIVILGWLSSVIGAGISLKVVSIQSLKKHQLVLGILMISASLVITPFLDIESMLLAPPVTLDNLLVMITIIMSVSAAAVMISALNWLRLKHFQIAIWPNMSAALFITTGLLAIQFCSMASVEFAANTTSNTTDTLNSDMLAVLVALGAIGLVLASFVSTLLYLKVDQGKLSLNINLDEKNSDELTKLAMVDSLTHLPNRRYFQHHLELATHRVSRGNGALAIAFIDLDGFKRINDTLGHHVGDKLLIAVANRLSTAVRGCDMVARLGGDEFVALLEDVKSDDEIIPIVERIIYAVHETFNIDHQEINISASVGISVAPRDGDMAKLIVKADTAMYRAKSDGKNRYRFYDAAIEFASEQLSELQQDLRRALNKHEFQLYFQPKINSLNHEIIGLETLIRWQHPTKGDIPPSAFLAAAEHFGLMNKIGDWVIDETCRTIHRMRNQGIHLPVAINLSAQQFRNKNLVKNILKTLKRFDLPTSSLMFELTESTAINNADLVNSLLNDFQISGFSTSMDDFGTGQSSLVYLQTVKVNELKLDRSFTKDITSDKQSQGIVGAIVKLAHAIGLKVVAEGVETDEQYKLLVDLGCDQLQGYLISHPVTENQIVEVIRKGYLHHKLKNNVIPFGILQ